MSNTDALDLMQAADMAYDLLIDIRATELAIAGLRAVRRDGIEVNEHHLDAAQSVARKARDRAEELSLRAPRRRARAGR